MKKIGYLLVISIMLSGCAAGSLSVNPDDLKTLQTTGDGEPTSGCVTANLNGSSGVIGGASRVIVTWGELEESIINWCIGR